MKRFPVALLLVVSLLIGLLGMPATALATEASGSITLDLDSGPVDCVEDHAVKHVNDVVSSPNYYIVHYPPYGIFWIVLGVEDTVRCLRIPV